MVDLVTVRIDASDVVDGLQDLSRAIDIANRSAVARIQEGLRSIVIGSVEAAIQQAGDAFHPIYQVHLREGIRKIQPEVYATADGLVAQYYDIEGLGDYSDLEAGFHYHALIDVDREQFSVTNPQIVELPYAGQELENPFEERYAFWLAVVAGAPYEVTFGKGTKSHKKLIPTEGLYEQTLRARVSVWGDRYPEWLLLEYGTDFEPRIPATHVKYFIEQRVYEFMVKIYEEIIDEVVRVWDSPGVTTNSIGQLIDQKTGRFVKYIPEGLK